MDINSNSVNLALPAPWSPNSCTSRFFSQALPGTRNYLSVRSLAANSSLELSTIGPLHTFPYECRHPHVTLIYNRPGMANGSPQSSPFSPACTSLALASSTAAAQRRTEVAYPIEHVVVLRCLNLHIYFWRRFDCQCCQCSSGWEWNREGKSWCSYSETTHAMLSDPKKIGSDEVATSRPLISALSPASPSHLTTALGRGSTESRRPPATREAKQSLDIRHLAVETSSHRGPFEIHKRIFWVYAPQTPKVRRGKSLVSPQL